jgi:hypothetical protein
MYFLIPLSFNFSAKFGSSRDLYDVRIKIGPVPVKNIPAFMIHLLSEPQSMKDQLGVIG